MPCPSPESGDESEERAGVHEAGRSCGGEARRGRAAPEIGSGDVRPGARQRALSTRVRVRDTAPSKAESHVAKQASWEAKQPAHTRPVPVLLPPRASGLGFLPDFLPRGKPRSSRSLRRAPSNQPLASFLPALTTKPKPATAAQWMEAEPADEKGKKGAVGGGDGLEWGLERQFAFEREMLLMDDDGPGAEPLKLRRGWRKRPFAADLLQNCDLPPPTKLFGPVPTLQRLESAAGAGQKKADDAGGGGNNNDSLMRALRLSQSRAREAEEKLAAAGASYGDLAALLVRDAVALSAHRRWVVMLEAENSLLRGAARVHPDDDDGDGDGGVAAWWVALAVCVGIAGVGLALGRFLC